MPSKEARERYRISEKGKANACKGSKTWREKNPDYLKQWREANPDKIEEYNLRHHVARHNVSLEWYEKILEEQNHKCAMCNQSFVGDQRPDIDHNHKCCPGSFSCGKCIRGLIHSKCNRALGQLNDDPRLALKAYNYLSKGETSMSSFRQQTTEMSDQKCLEDALKGLGYKPSVSKEKQLVRGHYNETRKAEIVLKKEDLKEGGDVGFEKDSKGNFAIVTDTYVMRNGFNLEKFTKTLKQKYAEVKIRKVAQSAGLTFLRKIDTQNGGYKMQFVKA